MYRPLILESFKKGRVIWSYKSHGRTFSLYISKFEVCHMSKLLKYGSTDQLSQFKKLIVLTLRIAIIGPAACNLSPISEISNCAGIPPFATGGVYLIGGVL
jgi:hypothetical protein